MQEFIFGGSSIVRKFISLVLTASIISLSLGALVEKATASLPSDDKALALIEKARRAIGGSDAIAGVKSMRIKGSMTKTFEFNGQSRIENGESEIALMLPDKMVRTIKLGNGPEGLSGPVVKQMGVMVTGPMPPLPPNGSGVTRIIVKDKDGELREIPQGQPTGTFGTVEENGQVRKMVVRVDTVGGEADSQVGPAGSVEGRRIVMDRDAHLAAGGGGAGQNELLRTMLSLLMTAPDGMNVSYTYGGSATVDGIACEVVNAAFGGSEYRLHLAADSGLPVMIAYKGFAAPTVVAFRTADDQGAAPKSDTIIMRRADVAPPQMTEIEVRFGDFRNVGGINLPFRWSQTTGGKADETFTVSSYDINPADIANSFKDVKVVVRGDAKEK